MTALGPALTVRHLLPRLLTVLVRPPRSTVSAAAARLASPSGTLQALVVVAARTPLTCTERIIIPRLMYLVDCQVVACRGVRVRASSSNAGSSDVIAEAVSSAVPAVSSSGSETLAERSSEGGKDVPPDCREAPPSSTPGTPAAAAPSLGSPAECGVLVDMALLRDALQALALLCPTLSSSCVRSRVLAPSQLPRRRTGLGSYGGSTSNTSSTAGGGGGTGSSVQSGVPLTPPGSTTAANSSSSTAAVSNSGTSTAGTTPSSGGIAAQAGHSSAYSPLVSALEDALAVAVDGTGSGTTLGSMLTAVKLATGGDVGVQQVSAMVRRVLDQAPLQLRIAVDVVNAVASCLVACLDRVYSDTSKRFVSKALERCVRR